MTDILIPDIGNFESVDVIEILVKPGDHVNKDDPLITLESDKASMDIPASESGIIKEIKVSVGDKVKQGVAIATFEAVGSEVKKKEEKKAPEVTSSKEVQKKIISEPSRPFPEPPQKIQPENKPVPVAESIVADPGKKSHASPSVRRFARELGVNLSFVSGTGRKKRILIEDVQNFVKGELSKPTNSEHGGFVCS